MKRLSLAQRFRWVQCLILALLFGLHCAAAPFQNLDFEQANTNSLKLNANGIIDAPSGPITELIPGWQVFSGTNLLTSIAYNGGFAFGDDGGGPMLVGLNDPFPPSGFSGKPIDGQFSFGVEFTFRTPPITLVQRGDIPIDAQYLAFTFTISKPFALGINGVDLIGKSTGFTGTPMATYFYDVSKFRGENVELTFRPSVFTSELTGFHELDAIAFIVPEPGTFALFGLGALGLLTIGRRRRILQRKC